MSCYKVFIFCDHRLLSKSDFARCEIIWIFNRRCRQYPMGCVFNAVSKILLCGHDARVFRHHCYLYIHVAVFQFFIYPAGQRFCHFGLVRFEFPCYGLICAFWLDGGGNRFIVANGSECYICGRRLLNYAGKERQTRKQDYNNDNACAFHFFATHFHIAERLCSNVCPEIAAYTPPIARYARAIRTAAMIINVKVSYKIFLIISHWGASRSPAAHRRAGHFFKEVIMPECFYAASQTYS